MTEILGSWQQMKGAPRRIQPALQAESPHGPAAAVPLAEARNRLSALVDSGVCVQAAVEKLLQLRDGLVLEGYLRAIAREGPLGVGLRIQ